MTDEEETKPQGSFLAAAMELAGMTDEELAGMTDEELAGMTDEELAGND